MHPQPNPTCRPRRLKGPSPPAALLSEQMSLERAIKKKGRPLSHCGTAEPRPTAHSAPVTDADRDCARTALKLCCTIGLINATTTGLADAIHGEASYHALARRGNYIAADSDQTHWHCCMAIASNRPRTACRSRLASVAALALQKLIGSTAATKHRSLAAV